MTKAKEDFCVNCGYSRKACSAWNRNHGKRCCDYCTHKLRKDEE
jgi:hypothetical protein